MEPYPINLSILSTEEKLREIVAALHEVYTIEHRKEVEDRYRRRTGKTH